MKRLSRLGKLLTVGACVWGLSCSGKQGPAPATPSPNEPNQAPAAGALSLDPGEQLRRMRAATQQPGRFRDAFEQKRAALEPELGKEMPMPVPKDAGGGYTHERHKLNRKQMYDAGNLYRLTGDAKYVDFIRKSLLSYAKLYPTLPIHPKKKNSNSGKLFWQGLNEAVWLVHTIQAYAAVKGALTADDRAQIENGVLRPMAKFLSEESPRTFNKIHNHATWATCAVGMTGYVLDEPEWVERALFGLDKSGRGGFMRQLDELFSPDGYYNEGPYYQRYALMPFVTFAQAIEQNDPQRKIFEHRDGILLKAIYSTVELSYNRLFFPLNDAIKSKGIDTYELVNGVALAYNRTRDASLLDIAQQQGSTLLTPNGFEVASALEQGLATPFQFRSRVFRDGKQGDRGALAVLRHGGALGQALLLKATSQGGGHGHFDKLGWQLYDHGAEIISDYGAARFLNIEAKFGGRYLPENKTYAKQTVAHNTLVVDGRSHFDFDKKVAEQRYPSLIFFAENDQVAIASAKMEGAYPDVEFTRTVALLKREGQPSLAVDLLRVSSDSAHRYDLPVHYQGHFIDSSFPLETSTKQMAPLGDDHGYQHLWQRAIGSPKAGPARVTFLNDNGRFYSYFSLVRDAQQVLLTELGASDPHLNLRRENALILRAPNATNYDFVSVVEPHGEYNPGKEYTLGASASVTQIRHARDADAEVVLVSAAGEDLAIAFSTDVECPPDRSSEVMLDGKTYRFVGRFGLFRQ